MGKKKLKFVEVGSIDNKDKTYRITFSCPANDLEYLSNEINQYGEVLKVETVKGE